jgi:hypothetical protein
MMAAPVFAGKELVSIIMLWDITFEQLTLYNAGRLMVISRLVSSVIERAYTHDKEMRGLNYLPGTNILSAHAFQDILETYKDALNKNTTDFKLLEVSDSGGNAADLTIISQKVGSLLRKNDFMGQNPKDGNGILVLLTGTNAAGLEIVFARLKNEGLTAKEVSF